VTLQHNVVAADRSFSYSSYRRQTVTQLPR